MTRSTLSNQVTSLNIMKLQFLILVAFAGCVALAENVAPVVEITVEQPAVSDKIEEFVLPAETNTDVAIDEPLTEDEIKEEAEFEAQIEEVPFLSLADELFENMVSDEDESDDTELESPLDQADEENGEFRAGGKRPAKRKSKPKRKRFGKCQGKNIRRVKCKPNCEATCGNRKRKCHTKFPKNRKKCRGGCICKRGHARMTNNECIRTNKCPRKNVG